MPTIRRPEWQLPEGVPRGAWQYAQAEHVAERYDDYFALNQLFEFDQQVLARHFTRPGLVVDLGCGTGRSLVPLARRGFRGLAVDLSPAMLRIVRAKAEAEQLPIQPLLANLVQLDCIRDRSVDYAVCLFSTLGMVRGRRYRQRVLGHVRRILKPGGLFVIHVHNLWFNLFDPLGRRWLLTHLGRWLLRTDKELGDKFFLLQDIPQMFLHTFTQHELLAALKAAGFRPRELIPLDVARQRPLSRPWWFGRFRANGWIVVSE